MTREAAPAATPSGRATVGAISGPVSFPADVVYDDVGGG